MEFETLKVRQEGAVLFADIVTPVLGMGIGVELVEGVGPVVARPVASAADVARLHVSERRPRLRHSHVDVTG